MNRSWLLTFACLLGVLWIVEQPITSVFWFHPAMQIVRFLCRPDRIVTYLGAFGGSSVKPLSLVGTVGAQRMSMLKRKRPKMASSPKFWVRNKRRWVSGGKLLHVSGAYTAEFGEAITSALLQT